MGGSGGEISVPVCHDISALKFKNSGHFGLRRTRITESPRTKSLLMKRSLFTAFDFFFSLPFGVSVHISRTFSSTMLQCRSKAFTRASIFRLFLQFINTWVVLHGFLQHRQRAHVEIVLFGSFIGHRKVQETTPM